MPLPEGVVLTKLNGHHDERGDYLKFFDKQFLHKDMNVDNFNPTDAAVVTSAKGSKRGLKLNEGAPAKLAYLFSGKLDVTLIDRRTENNSESKLTMRAGDNDLLFVPKGVVWGNEAIEDSVIVYATEN